MSPFLFEAHSHTSESSDCGYLSARELVDLHHRLGYDGIAITDHLIWDGYWRQRGRGNWDGTIDMFLEGYKRAKARGDELGFNVILGAELRFTESFNDYLIYGIDEGFLRGCPDMCHMGVAAFFRQFGESVLIIQAHPYRYGNMDVPYSHIHGVEVLNAHERWRNNNEKALALCKSNPGLYRLCGSDVHDRGQEGLAYVQFERPVTDSFEFKAAIESRRYLLGCKHEKDRAVLREATKIHNSQKAGKS